LFFYPFFLHVALLVICTSNSIVFAPTSIAFLKEGIVFSGISPRAPRCPTLKKPTSSKLTSAVCCESAQPVINSIDNRLTNDKITSRDVILLLLICFYFKYKYCIPTTYLC